MTLGRRRSQLMLALILTGMTCGLLVGWRMGPRAAGFAPLGSLFVSALQILVMPLVVTSVVTGAASLGELHRVRAMTVRVLGWILLTTTLASAMGLIVALIVRPGVGVALTGAAVPDGLARDATHAWSALLALVHPSLVSAMAEMQLAPVLLFSLAFGVALTTVRSDGARSLVKLFEAANEALLRIADVVMWLAPIGVFGLVAGEIGRSGGVEGFLPAVQALSRHAGVVVGALLLHAGLVIGGLLALVGKRRLLPYVDAASPALLTAFSTASSSATLPVTLETVMGPCGVAPLVARFVAPIGATINRNGTALHSAAAGLFVAQAYGIEITFKCVLLVLVAATLAAIGTAGLPESGLVATSVVLATAGLPAEGLGLLVAIDWLLERFRAAVNVWGDVVGAVVVEQLEMPQAAGPVP